MNYFCGNKPNQAERQYSPLYLIIYQLFLLMYCFSSNVFIRFPNMVGLWCLTIFWKPEVKQQSHPIYWVWQITRLGSGNDNGWWLKSVLFCSWELSCFLHGFVVRMKSGLKSGWHCIRAKRKYHNCKKTRALAKFRGGWFDQWDTRETAGFARSWHLTLDRVLSLGRWETQAPLHAPPSHQAPLLPYLVHIATPPVRPEVTSSQRGGEKAGSRIKTSLAFRDTPVFRVAAWAETF